MKMKKVLIRSENSEYIGAVFMPKITYLTYRVYLPKIVATIKIILLSKIRQTIIRR